MTKPRVSKRGIHNEGRPPIGGKEFSIILPLELLERLDRIVPGPGQRNNTIRRGLAWFLDWDERVRAANKTTNDGAGDMSATEGMHPVDVAIHGIIAGGQEPVRGFIGLGGVELEKATEEFVGVMVMLTAQSLSKPDPGHGKEFFIKTGKRHALTFARGLARSYGTDAVCAELREKITDPEIVAATTGENADADFPFTVIFTAVARAVDLVAEAFPPRVELTDQTVPDYRHSTDWSEFPKGMIGAASRFGGESALAEGWRTVEGPAEPSADD